MNLLRIVSDTLRADPLGCYGNQRVQTPKEDVAELYLLDEGHGEERDVARQYPPGCRRASREAGRVLPASGGVASVTVVGLVRSSRPEGTVS
jgi:hypothetical protein